MIFGEYSDIVENDFLTMQRFLDISRFLYSGGWQVLEGELTVNVDTKDLQKAFYFNGRIVNTKGRFVVEISQNHGNHGKIMAITRSAELAIIISYPTDTSGILIVLLKTATKYR